MSSPLIIKPSGDLKMSVTGRHRRGPVNKAGLFHSFLHLTPSTFHSRYGHLLIVDNY